MKRGSERQTEAKGKLRRLRKLSPLHREIMLRVLKGKKEVENTEKSMCDMRREVFDVGIDALVILSKLVKDERVSARVRFQIAREVWDWAGLRES